MKNIKIGDIVGRISYGKDIIFEVTEIKSQNGKIIAILKGVIERIEANSEIDDLEILDEKEVLKKIRKIEEDFEENLDKNKRNIENTIKGKILHLDGDRKYSEKSYKFYRKLGLDVVVKNIPEAKQPYMIKYLIGKYNPDILVITGHDSLLKKSRNYNNIENYKNSKYFIETVKQARKEKDGNKLAIFAGACQSFYEGIIYAGANFASAPARILIDFTDPLIVANKIASTKKERFLTIEDIEGELKNGRRGVNGVGSYGKMGLKMNK